MLRVRGEKEDRARKREKKQTKAQRKQNTASEQIKTDFDHLAIIDSFDTMNH